MSKPIPGLLAPTAAPHLAGIAAAAQELVRHGWAEANAGNMSVRLGSVPEFAGTALDLLAAHPPLAAFGLLITATGSRMRDVARDPLPGLCLVRVAEDGVTAIWTGGFPPSSELPAHLAGHARLAQSRPADTCLVHTHPTALTALTLIYPEPTALVAVLLRSHTELAPWRSRITMLPFLAPGSLALAEHSAKALARHQAVIWPRHGIIASGASPARALDAIEVCDKAAEIALLAGRLQGPAPARTHGPARPAARSDQPSIDGIETFHDVRYHDSPLPAEEFLGLKRNPLHVVLDNLRSAFNVGSIFRIADAARLAEVVLCGYTCRPPNHKLEQTALGTTASVPWRGFDDATAALAALRFEGVQLVGVETAETAVPYDRFEYGPRVALVFGNEALGLSQDSLRLCDGIVRIPLSGYKNSLNVAAAAAVVVYNLLERKGWLH